MLGAQQRISFAGATWHGLLQRQGSAGIVMGLAQRRFSLTVPVALIVLLSRLRILSGLLHLGTRLVRAHHHHHHLGQQAAERFLLLVTLDGARMGWTDSFV